LLGTAEPRAEGEEVVAESAGPTVHPVEAYAGTPGGSAGGVLVALVFGLIGAAVLGFAAAFIHQYFWLVLVFAALYGLALGGIVGLGAWVGKCRLKGGVIAAGAVTGLAGAFLLHYFGYQLAIRDLPALGFLSFTQYLDFRCIVGVSIGSLNLGYTGTIIYWLAEAAVIVIASAAVAPWPIKKPFCAGCNVWKTKRSLGKFRLDAPRAVQAVAAGQPAAMVAPATTNDQVTVAVYSCPKCGDANGVEVQVSGTQGTGESAVTMTVCVSYPGAAVADFEKIRQECERMGLEIKK
jgi:hypothetical protein